MLPKKCLLPVRISSLLLFTAIIILWRQEAYAYIGPGAGFAFLSSFFVFFLTFFLAAIALLSWPFRYVVRLLKKTPTPKNALAQKVVVVGLDGLDPSLLKRLQAEGELPHFAKLEADGTFATLATTLPALSPVAWSTFQTGVHPGKHNIFDFLHRNPRTYLGELSSARIRSSPRSLKIGRLRIPLAKPDMALLRKSQPFWKILGDHGVFSIIQRVPITFPPERFKGISLSAMCVPDLLGTQGTFTYYTTRQGEPSTRTGGQSVNVTWQSDVIRTWIFGPQHPFRDPPKALKIPLLLRREQNGLILKIQGQHYRLSPRTYSPWIRIYFKAAGMKIRGIVRFYLRATEPELSLYMTPIHLDPERPALPISHPAMYSLYLAKTQGSFATLGLAEDTWALNEGALDDESFIEQCNFIHAERESMFFNALKKMRKGLLVCVFDITDRIQHMFWRYHDPRHPARGISAHPTESDPVRDVYKRVDAMLGAIMELIADDTWLIVLSDHGFTSFRRGVNLNTWLYQNRYLCLKDGAQPGQWFKGVDWDRTKAFALGLGGLFINQKGRERFGIVSPGAETHALKEELVRRLTHLKDDETGETAIAKVYDSAVHFSGPYRDNAPDLLIGYNHGYRASWESVTGEITDSVFSDNLRCWSGDHCVDPEKVPGVFLVNKKLHIRQAAMVDIAPTILTLFGIRPPDYMDGKPLTTASVPEADTIRDPSRGRGTDERSVYGKDKN